MIFQYFFSLAIHHWMHIKSVKNFLGATWKYNATPDFSDPGLLYVYDRIILIFSLQQ